MAGRACHHCKEWIEEGEAHGCWTTTEAALTADLPDDLREAWERLREMATDFGEQRIYASGTAICRFASFSAAIRSPLIRRVKRTSRTKLVHMVLVTHRDQLEPPVTDWLREAYDLPDERARRRVGKPSRKSKQTKTRKTRT